MSQNYSLETQIIFELGNYTTTWKAGKKFWAMIRVLNNFWSCVGFGTKYRLRNFFHPFRGNFKGKARPPLTQFKHYPSCRPFATFVRKTLLDRIHSGAISLLGRVGQVHPPHLVLPLTVDPTKPRLCHGACFLNLWMADAPFKLDSLSYLTQYVGRQCYQTILDDKSGYDHLLLAEESRTYFGIQWGGRYCHIYNTQISPFVYQRTGLVATNFFRSLGIPCLLYIDDRHNGQLQVDLNRGPYSQLQTMDERNLAAANLAIFLVCYFLV